MNISTDPLGTGTSEKNPALASAQYQKDYRSAVFKLLFAATAGVAVLLSYRVAREAIGLNRVLFNDLEKTEEFARVPVHFARSVEPR